MSAEDEKNESLQSNCGLDFNGLICKGNSYLNAYYTILYYTITIVSFGD